MPGDATVCGVVDEDAVVPVGGGRHAAELEVELYEDRFSQVQVCADQLPRTSLKAHSKYANSN